MRQLRKLEELTGYLLHARDGEIGKLKQIYFDDKHWTVPYFVVHIGSWLLGQDVLVVPSVVTAVHDRNKCLDVDLLREQIRNSPPVNTEMPVSRHYEQEYYCYYDWEPYWTGDLLSGAIPYSPPPDVGEEPGEPEHPHLRSSNEVTGYHIHARDDEFGHIEDFILEDPGWSIGYLEIDTRNWLPGRKVLVAPAWINSVDWEENKMSLALTREQVKNSPEYDSSLPLTPEYEVSLSGHYGLPVEQGIGAL